MGGYGRIGVHRVNVKRSEMVWNGLLYQCGQFKAVLCIAFDHF